MYNNKITALVVLVLAVTVAANAAKDVPATGSELESKKFMEKITSSKQSVDPLAKQICGRTESPDICEKTVMETNAKSEPLGPKIVCVLQLEALAKDVSLAIKDCDGMKDKSHEFCAGSYKKADEELTNAVNVSKGNDFKMAMVLIQGAMKHVDTCQTELKNAKSKSHLKEVNEFLVKLSDNSISVANAILTGAIKRRR